MDLDTQADSSSTAALAKTGDTNVNNQDPAALEKNVVVDGRTDIAKNF